VHGQQSPCSSQYGKQLVFRNQAILEGANPATPTLQINRLEGCFRQGFWNKQSATLRFVIGQ
jgi:hypothetical protein